MAAVPLVGPSGLMFTAGIEVAIEVLVWQELAASDQGEHFDPVPRFMASGQAWLKPSTSPPKSST
jgi:hypothetical protein